MFDKYIDAVKGFIPKLIALLASFVVGTLIYQLAGPAMGLTPELGLVGDLTKAIAVVVSASLLTVLVVTALDQG